MSDYRSESPTDPRLVHQATPTPQTATKKATFDADGNATVVLEFPGSSGGWVITQISISTTSARTTSAELSLNDLFLTATRGGNRDTAGGAPVTMRSGESLKCEWTTGEPGSVATLSAIYTEA